MPFGWLNSTSVAPYETNSLSLVALYSYRMGRVNIEVASGALDSSLEHHYPFTPSGT